MHYKAKPDALTCNVTQSRWKNLLKTAPVSKRDPKWELKATITHRWVLSSWETISKHGTGSCPYRVYGAVQVAVGGRARGHLATVGCQGEVDDTAQSLALLILHSLSAGCHGYLSICPPIWRGWSLGRHPGKKKEETGDRKMGRERKRGGRVSTVHRMI